MTVRSHTLSTVAATRWRMFLLLGGWCIATGALWDFVQVGAWARMWVQNAQTLAPSAALARTFSPEGMCEMCHAVQAAKLGSSENVLPPLLEKAPLLLTAAQRVVLEPPRVFVRPRLVAALMAPVARMRPPVPPPRLPATMA